MNLADTAIDLLAGASLSAVNASPSGCSPGAVGHQSVGR